MNFDFLQIGETAWVLHPGRHQRPGDSRRVGTRAGHFHLSPGARRSGREHRTVGRQRRGAGSERHRGQRQEFGSGDGHDGGQQLQPDHHGQTGQPEDFDGSSQGLILEELQHVARIHALEEFQSESRESQFRRGSRRRGRNQGFDQRQQRFRASSATTKEASPASVNERNTFSFMKDRIKDQMKATIFHPSSLSW